MEVPEFEALMLAQQRPLLALVQRWVGNRDDAAEIVQEAAVRLWKRRADLRSDTAAAYLYRTASNLAMSHRRWQRVRTALQHKLDPPSTTAPPEDPMVDAERSAALRAALGELPEALRRVIELRDFTELGYPEIASMLAIKEGTVGSRRNAALVRLRGALLASLALGSVLAWWLRPELPPPSWPFAADHPAVAALGHERPPRQPLAAQPTHVPGVSFYRVEGGGSAAHPP